MKRILQLSLLLYGLSFFPMVISTAMAQTKQPLNEVLKKIENVYGAKFVSEKNLFEGVTVNYTVPNNKSKSLELVLKEVLYPKGFLFLFIEKNYYTIVKDSRINSPSATDLPSSADAPAANVNGKRTLSGRVTDNAGNSLPGVTIKPEGSKYGITTSSDGSYSITFDYSYKYMVFSYIGMVSQREEIQAKNILNVKLVPDDNTLNEVQVVSTGYEKLPKERATGSFGFITAKEIAKTPAINVMERLVGKVPGVNINVATNQIFVRSLNTYGVNTQPLIVVDGFPLMAETNGNTQLTKLTNSSNSGNSLISRINPDDIESISFLKDAAATSIWGSNAANGVIVIETKKGKTKQPSINLSSSLSISASPDLGKLNTMSSAQYINLEQELFNKGFISDPATWTTGYYTFNTNPNTSDALEWMFKAKRGTATTAQRDSALNVLSGIDNTAQKKKYLLQNAVTKQYNLSISGGGENNTYYISGNMADDKPIYKNNNAKSYNFTVNTTNSFFNKRITLSTGLTYNTTNSKTNTAANTALGTTTQGLRPYDLLVDNNGNNINRYLIFRPEVINNFTSKGYLPWTYSAVDELNYSNLINKENRIRANAGIKGKILDWLDVDVSGTYQTAVSETIAEDELNSYNTRTLINIGTSISPTTGKLVYGVPYGGVYKTTNQSASDYSVRGVANVHKIWNSIHQLNVIAGTEIRQTQSKNYGNTVYGFNDDTYNYLSVNPSVDYQTIYPYTQNLGGNSGSVTLGKRRYISYFSNASYSLMDKYVASASVRFEDYTQMGASSDKRGKPFYSAGLKWNTKREDFMKHADFMSALDLRLTYGTGGSIPTSGFNTAVISTSGVDPLTNKPYGSLVSPANDQLSWELTKQLNGGVDMGLFNNRLMVNFDIYQKRSSGIVVSLPYNATYGWSNVSFNAATLQSHGLEFGLQGAIIRKNDWGWNSNLTFAYSNNKVTDARYLTKTDVTLTTASVPIVGLPLDYLYVYKWAGLDNTGQSQIYDRNGNIVKSTTNNTALGADDLKYAGRKTAPYYGGWSNDFNYKSFSLNVMMTYYMGGHFLKSSINNYPTNIFTTYSGVIGTQEDLALRWQNPGDELTTDVPGLTGINSNSITRYRYSDLLVRSSSHVRLQQIALSYSLSQRIIKHTPFKALSASVSARNLGIIWRKNKDGIDPDYISTATVGNLPPTKNFVFGVNASF